MGKTLRWVFPKLTTWMGHLPDGRDGTRITYSPSALLWLGLLTFCFKLSSRRQIRYELDTPAAAANFRLLTGSTGAKPAHPDTLEHYLRLLKSGALAGLMVLLVKQLIRRRTIEDQRVRKHYLIAVDGTGQFTFNRRHCEHCLTRKHKDGRESFHHNILEAKLVCPSGLTMSVSHQFVVNDQVNPTKQDCELKAFGRLASRLKKDFPYQLLCLVLDGIYAAGAVMKICQDNHWKYIITFKQGSAPALWSQFQSAKYHQKLNHLHCQPDDDGVQQSFAWANGLTHKDDQGRVHQLNAFECIETAKGQVKTFVWLTNFTLHDGPTVRQLANQAGRQRWKIENQGFNTQKHGGYALEHLYSTDPNAMQHWYVLLQIAHLIMQLIERSNLLGESVRELFGSDRNVGRFLAEGLRHFQLTEQMLTPMQLRFNSS